MKRRMITGILLLLLALIRIPAALADAFENPVYTQEEIAGHESVLSQKDQLFPRFIFQETFDVGSKPVVSKPADGFYRYEMVRAGKYESMLAAYAPVVKSEGWGEQRFNTTGSYEDFYMAIEMQMIELDDSGTGYLWFQYTDKNLVGEENRNSVTFEFPISIYSYKSGAGGRDYTIHYDLSEYKNDFQVHKVEIIRLDGFVRFYLDGHFITGFDDGFYGRFYQLYGIGLNTGGTYVAGSFDNFILRVR